MIRHLTKQLLYPTALDSTITRPYIMWQHISITKHYLAGQICCSLNMIQHYRQYYTFTEPCISGHNTHYNAIPLHDVSIQYSTIINPDSAVYLYNSTLRHFSIRYFTFTSQLQYTTQRYYDVHHNYTTTLYVTLLDITITTPCNTRPHNYVTLPYLTKRYNYYNLLYNDFTILYLTSPHNNNTKSH